MPPSKAQRAKTAARRNQAIALRLAGASWDDIARQLGYASRGAACTDVTRALEQYVTEGRVSAEVLREQELRRLDRLQATLWPQALQGDTKVIETVLRIIDRRCRILGLNAPERHEVVTLDAVEAEIRRLSAELENPVNQP